MHRTFSFTLLFIGASMLALRIFIGAASVGCAFGSFACVSSAASVSGDVHSVLMQTAVLGAIGAVLFAFIAICCDHRTASEKRTAERRKRELQRIRHYAALDRERALARSRNRF